jgi:hypothetical protein
VAAEQDSGDLPGVSRVNDSHGKGNESVKW